MDILSASKDFVSSNPRAAASIALAATGFAAAVLPAPAIVLGVVQAMGWQTGIVSGKQFRGRQL